MFKTYLRLFGYARPISKYAIPYFVCALLHAVFNVFNFTMLIPIIGVLFDGSQMIETVVTRPEFSLSIKYLEDMLNFYLYKMYGASYDVREVLVFLSVIVVTSVFLSNLFRYLAQRIMENLRIHMLENLRNNLFDHVMGLNVSFMSGERKGDIISKITADVQVVQYCVTNTLQVLFRDPLLIITYFIGLIKISGQLTLFTLLILPFAALIIGVIVKRLRHTARQAQDSFGDMVSLLDESLAGTKIIKSYNATDYIKDKFKNNNGTFSRISRAIARRQQMASPASEFLGVSAVSVILIYGGGLVLDGALSASMFLGYLAIFSQVTRPVRSFADSFSTIHQGIAAGDRVFQLLDTQNTIVDKEDAVELSQFKDSIEFRNVSFSYGAREVLHNVSFTIKKGETVALVGPSGGGKSTITDLIPRFYDVDSGEILIDGRNIKDYTIESLRARMGMVAQDTVLFNDSIANNIKLGKRDAAESEVVSAAKVANADSFICETENGYEANIGDRGMKLSGGQRQRLSIARAVLKNPEILILDEATSALDTESEKLVQDALSQLLKGRTSLVVAHRLSTIQHADKIIVIDKGLIAESGTHHQLMANKKIYAKLIEMQQLN